MGADNEPSIAEQLGTAEVLERPTQWAVVLDDASAAAVVDAEKAAIDAVVHHGGESREVDEAIAERDRLVASIDVARINDLPYKVTRAIAKEHGLLWSVLGEFPASIASNNPDAAIAIINAAAAHAGKQSPAIPESHGELVRFFAGRFVEVPDDLPETHENGIPLTDAQTTG